MQPVTLSDEDYTLYLKFKLKQNEEDYYQHKTNVETLVASNSEDSITLSLIDIEKKYMTSLDEAHAELKTKLDNI